MTLARRCAPLAALALFLGAVGYADAPPESGAPTETSAQVDPSTEQEGGITLYAGPRPLDLRQPFYPQNVRQTAGEGWVNLQFMVDVEGKPYEIVVTDSVGHRAFRNAAIRALRGSTFEPANLNGKPLDAGLRQKYKFTMEGKAAVGRAVGTAARHLARSVEQGDKAGADSAMERIDQLTVGNLPEDAWLSAAKYTYYEKWGTRAEQLEVLNRAVAHERGDAYLPRDAFRHAQLNRFRLLVSLNHFAEAIAAFESLQELDPNDERLLDLQAVVDNLEELRRDDRAFTVDGELDDHGLWSHRLFKDHFSLRDIEGAVVELKLYCDTAFVFFRFDDSKTYRIGEGHGDCNLTVVGNSGTAFTLAQG